MATRAIIRFATRESGVSFSEHPDKWHAQLFCRLDGHPESLGLDIANSISNRCFIPQETANYYTQLNKTKFATQNAETFFNKKFETLDGEHYTEEVHKQIAEKYIPMLKELT